MLTDMQRHVLNLVKERPGVFRGADIFPDFPNVAGRILAILWRKGRIRRCIQDPGLGKGWWYSYHPRQGFETFPEHLNRLHLSRNDPNPSEVEIQNLKVQIQNLQNALIAEGHEPECPVVTGHSTDCVPGTCTSTKIHQQAYDP